MGRLVLISTGLLLMAALVEAQTAHVTGTVFLPRGGVATEALVHLSGTLDAAPPVPGAAAGTAAQKTIALTQRVRPNGTFEFTGVPPGSYVMRADTPAVDPDLVAHSGTFRVDAGTKQVPRNLVLGPFGPRRLIIGGVDLGSLRTYGTLAGLAVYAGLLLVFRRQNIVSPARALLVAQVRSVRTRLGVEVDDAHRGKAEVLKAELDDIEKPFDRRTWDPTLFWSQGEEIAAWRRIHEVERQLATLLAPAARVIERVQLAEAELRAKQSPAGLVIADRMRDSLTNFGKILDATPPGSIEGHIERLQHQLAEALGLVYAERDTQFALLMEWQNKAMWLTAVATVLIAAIALSFGHEWLLLAGAAGGLISRLARALFRQDVPNDYGASWSTMFLSPLLGAVAAWFGVVLLVALRDLRVLGELLAGLTWDPAFNALTLAAAFVLGFSERLLTTLLTAVEGKIQPQAAPTAGAPPTTTQGVPPVNGARPATTTGAKGAAQAAATAGPTQAVERTVALLQLKASDRVWHVGKPDSLARRSVVAKVGQANVTTINSAGLSAVADAPAVLIEELPGATGLPPFAKAVAKALAPAGRAVVLAATPAASFDASKEALLTQQHAGPALVHAVMSEAGLEPEASPERLGSGDPVTWVSVFTK